jgi:hypothetical protein
MLDAMTLQQAITLAGRRPRPDLGGLNCDGAAGTARLIASLLAERRLTA